ncbi:MAG: hypothetical protein RI994_2054, partial [Pseudomonadota bacterium]
LSSFAYAQNEDKVQNRHARKEAKAQHEKSIDPVDPVLLSIENL